MTQYTTNAGTIITKHTLNLSKEALNLYTIFNKHYFDKELSLDELFINSVMKIYEAHKQADYYKFHVNYNYENQYRFNDNKTIVLAFSGGLDSAYQALTLREQGYNVILYHVKNMNYYTNGKEFQIVNQFSAHFEFPLVISHFKQNNLKENQERKYWQENSFKNILLYSIIIDYCIDSKVKNISCGDDLRLDIKDAVIGTNIADARQITKPFVENVKHTTGIDFIFVDHNINKAQRLKKLQQYDALDLFYSCVNPGRFNQSNHKRIQKKFNVNLEPYNCGVCRKCAFHSLLRHYYLDKKYPREFIDFCWDKIANGADNKFFNKELSLEERIKNLIEY